VSCWFGLISRPVRELPSTALLVACRSAITVHRWPARPSRVAGLGWLLAVAAALTPPRRRLGPRVRPWTAAFRRYVEMSISHQHLGPAGTTTRSQQWT
jgi:hypothetical protein